MGCAFQTAHAPHPPEKWTETGPPAAAPSAEPAPVGEPVAAAGKGDDALPVCVPISDDLGWMDVGTGTTSTPMSLVKSRAKEAVTRETSLTDGAAGPSPDAGRPCIKVQILIEGKWRDCDAEDNRVMCEHLARGQMSFTLEARGHSYVVDFQDSTKGVQMNSATQKTRQLRIIESDEGNDLGLDSDRQGGQDQVPSQEVAPAALQVSHGPQSKRGGATQAPFGVLDKHPHAQDCFETFRKNEERLCGEFAVFYHSYSFAALIYEVHAAVGSVLFRFRSQYSSLPRILVRDFDDIPDASTLMRRFGEDFARDKRDHHPEFRKVGISVMCSLMSTGPEACIPMVFIAGYSCKDLSFRGVLENLLRSCYVPNGEIKGLADQIIALSEHHGLDVSQFGGARCASGKAGHLLQIFVKRKLVDHLAYAALPYGPIDEARMPLSGWMNSNESFAVGQARIVAHPKYFMQANHIRMYVASADPTFHANRRAFQEDLTGLLNGILGAPELRHAAATGIYGGALPPWWTDEDQRTKL